MASKEKEGKRLMMFQVNDVVQFNENHKWCGSFGIITEIKDCGKNGVRYMIGVPVPLKGIAYIFVMNSENAVEKIGESIYGIRNNENPKINEAI